MRITLVHKREWKFKDAITGAPIQGLSYIGFAEDGWAGEFTSREDMEVYPSEKKFNPDKCIELQLIPKITKGGMIGWKHQLTA